jgi:hypothetical protein
VAIPPDAKYRFTFHDRSDVEHALDPALSVGPQTRNMAFFTVSIAPDRPIYFFGEVWIWIRYQASDGRQGSVVLAAPFEPGKLLAKLVGQDVLITTSAGPQVVSMVVTPHGLQRGLEEGYEPPLQFEVFLQLTGGENTLRLPYIPYGTGVGTEQLLELEIMRGRCRDIILRRSVLHSELSVGNRLAEVAAELRQGKSWAGDILGGMATDAATAILDARLEDDPHSWAAFHGLCVRHLVCHDHKLADYIIASYENYKDLDRLYFLGEAAAAMVIAPADNMVQLFDRLVAMRVVDWPSTLAMLHDQMLHDRLASDDWHSLVDHAGGPLGCGLYVRGTMHDWASPPPAEAMLQYLGEHRYGVTLLLMPERIRFKIADADWTERYNWGGGEPGAAALLGEALNLTCNYLSDNITLDLSGEPAAQRYTFEVNAVDPIHPTVTVSRINPGRNRGCSQLLWYQLAQEGQPRYFVMLARRPESWPTVTFSVQLYPNGLGNPPHTMNADVFNRIDMQALQGNPPSSLVGTSALPGPCK